MNTLTQRCLVGMTAWGAIASCAFGDGGHIYTNGPLVNGVADGCDPGDGNGPRDTTVTYTALGNNLTGLAVGSNFPARITDEFPLCSVASISEVVFHIWQSEIPNDPPGANEIATIGDMSLNIWDGRPDDLGSSIIVSIPSAVADASVTYVNEFAFLYRATDTDPAACQRPVQRCAWMFEPPINLGPGVYWLDYDATGTSGFGGPWIPPVGHPDVQTTGNSRQHFSGSWQFLMGGNGGYGPSGFVGAPFRISGVGGICASCDLNNDGDVNIDDLIAVLSNWGGPGGDCTGDDTTDIEDLLAILAGWGPSGASSAPAAPNDDEQGAIALAGYGVQGYDLGRSTTSASSSCVSGQDLWYTWTAPFSEDVTATAADAAAVAIYDADGVEIACGGVAGPTIVSWTATAAATYTVQVIEVGVGDGRFDELSFSRMAPENDECVDAIPAMLGTQAFSNIAATPDDAVEQGCDTSTSGTEISNDIWYVWTAPADGLLNVNTCEDFNGSADFDTDIIFYQGTPSVTACADTDGDFIPDGLTLLTCNDDAPDPCGFVDGGWHSHLDVPVVSGQNYTIRVGGWREPTDEGTGVLELDLTPGFAHQFCVNAVAIDIGDTVTGDTTGTIPDPLASLTCDDVFPTGGLWYTFVGDGNTVTITTCDVDTDYQSWLSVYCGECTTPICVAANDFDPTCSLSVDEPATVSFCTQPDVSYHVHVHGQTQGTFVMNISTDGLPCSPTVACP